MKERRKTVRKNEKKIHVLISKIIRQEFSLINKIIQTNRVLI